MYRDRLITITCTIRKDAYGMSACRLINIICTVSKDVHDMSAYNFHTS